MIPHCGLELHFPNDEWRWTSWLCLLVMCISLETTPVVSDEKSALILIAAPLHLMCLFSVAALIFLSLPHSFWSIYIWFSLFYLRLGSLSFLKICVYSFRKFLPTISSIFFPLLFFRDSNCSYIRLLNAVSQVTNIFSNYFFCVSFWINSIAISSSSLMFFLVMSTLWH